MAIFYHLVKRPVPFGEEAGQEKYFAQVRIGEVVTLEKLCDQVAELSSATNGDVRLIINRMVSGLCDYLEGGYIFQMGQFGNFRLSAGSEGVEKEEDFKLHMMKNPKIIFTPGRLLTRMLSQVRYKEIKPKEVIKYILKTQE